MTSAAVQHDLELKAYYQRKVNQVVPHREKAKMSALNAVRAKLINRVFATRSGRRSTEVLNT